MVAPPPRWPRPRRAPPGSPDPLAAHVIRLGAAILELRPRRGQKGGKRGKRVGSEADEGEGTAGSRPVKGGSQKQQPAARPQVPRPGPPLRLSAACHVRPRR